MRITPIRAYSSNLMTRNIQKNISFGIYDSPKTEKLMAENVLDMDDEDTGDLDREVFEFYKTTPFVIVKSTKDGKGKDIVYAVLNKEETDKHPNKARFDKLFENTELIREVQSEKIEIKEANDPNYLVMFEDYRDAYMLQEEIWEAEVDYKSDDEPDNKPSILEPEYEEDPYWKARDLYGYWL